MTNKFKTIELKEAYIQHNVAARVLILISIYKVVTREQV
jgi:hypothetical protein